MTARESIRRFPNRVPEPRPHPPAEVDSASDQLVATRRASSSVSAWRIASRYPRGLTGKTSIAPRSRTTLGMVMLSISFGPM